MESHVYQHTQIGWLTLGVLGACTLGAVLTFVSGGSVARWVAGGVGLVLIGTSILFSTLTIRVDAESVTWWFGPGLWDYSIPMDHIERVEGVRTSVIEGWGIRFTPKGRLYNVSGLDAVGITTSDGSFIRIGTDEPDALRQAIQSAR